MNEITKNLVINRDGQLDEEYLEAMLAAERKALLKQYGKDALKTVGRGTIGMAKGIVWIMTHDTRHTV